MINISLRATTFDKQGGPKMIEKMLVSFGKHPAERLLRLK